MLKALLLSQAISLIIIAILYVEKDINTQPSVTQCMHTLTSKVPHVCPVDSVRIAIPEIEEKVNGTTESEGPQPYGPSDQEKLLRLLAPLSEGRAWKQEAALEGALHLYRVAEHDYYKAWDLANDQILVGNEAFAQKLLFQAEENRDLAWRRILRDYTECAHADSVSTSSFVCDQCSLVDSVQ